MKINTKKLAAGPVMAAALLCAVSVGVNAPGISNVYAATVTESTGTSQTKRPEKGSQRGQNGEKPEEKGTRYVGKITSLTSSTITVELGEMKQKEKPAEGTSGTKPEKPADGTSGTRQKKSADSTDAAKDSAKEKKESGSRRLHYLPRGRGRQHPGSQQGNRNGRPRPPRRTAG